MLIHTHSQHMDMEIQFIQEMESQPTLFQTKEVQGIKDLFELR